MPPCPFRRDQRSAITIPAHCVVAPGGRLSLSLLALCLPRFPVARPASPSLLRPRPVPPVRSLTISSSTSRPSDEPSCPPLSWPGARSLSLISVQTWLRHRLSLFGLCLLYQGINRLTSPIGVIRIQSTAGFASIPARATHINFLCS